MLSLYVKINALDAGSRRGGGRWGKMQGAQDSWLWGRDLSGWEIRRHEIRTFFPIKWVLFLFITGKYAFQIKNCSLRRTKINQASGSEICVYSWYTSPHGSKHRLHVVSLTLQFGIVSSGSGNSKAHEFGFNVVFHAKGSISVVVNSLCGVNALSITSGRETQYCQTTTDSDSVLQITNRNLIQRCNAICTPDWAVSTYRLSLLQVDSFISCLCHFNSTGDFQLFSVPWTSG